MKTLMLMLLGLHTVMGMGHWCERTAEEKVERLLSPRLQLEVSCTEVYQYNTQGWRLDVDRMRVIHGGDDGIALYYKKQGPRASCFLYKPPEIESQTLNKTEMTCCEGWGGTHCSEAADVRGQCFSTWSCAEFPGIHNSSLMSMEQCCRSLWGLTWRNALDQTCMSCTYTLLPDSQSSPLVRSGLLGSTRATQGSATCMSWGGAHYRTFDRKHFHFMGSCTYVLASSADGTWAVYISSVCNETGDCSKALRMMLGLDLVSIRHRNLTLNALPVTNGEPIFQNGVSVYWLGDFVFVESGLGVRLKFDLANTVHLTVTEEHSSATRGLCGIFNNNADDDFTTVTGTVSQFAASFGNSWKIPDQQNEGCSDGAELGHSCDVSGDATLRRQAESMCHRLQENPFTHCHSRVDPAAYIDTCLYLYCSLPAKERTSAVCDTLASYVRECAQQHIIITWRTATLCDRVCPRGQVFSDCVSSCPPSCASHHPLGSAVAVEQCRKECVGGCECPPGLYSHRGLCLKREDCPCFHRRRSYKAGESIQQKCNICVCRAGQWECTGEKCAGQCVLVGALQVTTFDKKRYSLQGGDCAFTAIEDYVDGKLVVKVRCGACTAERLGSQGGGGDCLIEMSVTALRTTVTITDTGTVMLNGQRESLPVMTGALVVRRASSSFLLIQTFGAQLLWYLHGPLALITLQPGFANKVRGLCGTLNWNQYDDFTTPEGDVENGVLSFARKFTSEKCRLPGGSTPDPCTTYTQRRYYAETVCSVIHSPVFQRCHDVVEREPYLRLCLSEVCGCSPQKACHCTVLTAYAQQCAQEGIAIQWRNQTFCPVQCSGGQVYQECGRACGSSCSDLQQGWSCDDDGGSGPRMCVPGCQCPPGLLQDQQNQCVPAAMCPCVQEGKVYQPGALIQNSCNTCLCVQGSFNCTQDRCEETNPCPGTLVFSPRSCLVTCSSLDLSGQQPGQSSCKESLSGCVCPQGTVLLDDRCVLPEECPCHHNGRLYYSNDTITKDCNTCVCKERRWHCSQSACAGVCVATGDPHYVTFDGRCYSFLGDCQYVLARENSGLFSVTAENVPCGSTGVTCTKSVTLSLGNTVIHLLRGKAVTVNGMPVTLPKSYSGSGLSLDKVGLFVSLSSRLGVSLLWDGGMRVYIRLAAHLRGRVGGLCGNFDGDTENDFTTRQGIVESTPELFGNSWKLSPSCPDVADQDLRDPCALNAHRVTWARKKCAVLTQKLFAPCHTEVPFQQYYDWCVFDACGCDSGGDCECLCTAIAAYAEECNRRGVYIRWRSQELCPLQCENGLVYDPCGPACASFCPSVQSWGSQSECGILPCVEGCFCPAGTVRHGDSCVPSTECPCEWDGSMFPPGTTLTQHCQNCSCEDGTWQCKGEACPPPSPPCLESEFTCARGRCIPAQWVCDNEDDCGDGSDEVCPSTCSPDQFRCGDGPNGPCLHVALRCDGHPDCADQSDEEFCGPVTPVPLCPTGEFQCANGKCLPANRVCDGQLDCGFADGSDEQDCGRVCDEGEFLCVAGVRYWPGQQMKVDCEICVCERGKPQRCQPNPECSVHCGWSSWSEWGECLGPCGVQSVQWSFRSPNNPITQGDGRTCRGIYRKARRCQTDPCDECEHQTQTHAVGDRWKSDPCQLCQCLPNLTVQCSPYCPYTFTGCPQGQTLVPGEGGKCCYCQDTTPPVPTYPLPPGEDCWSPLGVQTLPASSFSASSRQTGHPPEAGWSPEPEEYKDLPPRRPSGHGSHTKGPYLQINLLQPYNITGMLTQGGGAFGTFVSSFYIQFSPDGKQWYTYKELVADARPRAKVFLANHDDRGVAEIRLDRMVSAQFIRLLPHDFQNGIYLRLEIMGCGDEKEFQCRNGNCVPAGPQGVVCDGVNDCGDGSDEMYCGVFFFFFFLDNTKGFPGLHNQTSSAGRPGFLSDSTTGAPGLHTTRSQRGSPGVATAAATGQPGLHPSTTLISGRPGLQSTEGPWITTTPYDVGPPRPPCVEGQFACRSFGCVASWLVCDGTRDCLDGSDEELCGTTARPAVTSKPPVVPSPCSSKQFQCGSGECVHQERRCDLQKDCLDGSDEKDCVDCIMSPWTAWSTCSVSCGLGSVFRQRDILREALPGGACGGAQFDSRSCFAQACQVDGQWSKWSEWSDCDVKCGGGVRHRNRTCSAPPPKNGGRDCEGMIRQTQTCNSQSCTTDVATQTGCVNGMVLVTEKDCQTGRVEPCPPLCSHLSLTSNCTDKCILGCRCPSGLYLQDGRCKNSSQCVCHWEGQTLQPGQTVNKDQCTTCVCREGQVTCDNSSCVASCQWSAWSSWSPCDVTCGLGLQHRYRSPVNPPGAVRVEPCLDDSSEVRSCSNPCLPELPDGVWGKWTAWSECSKTCFNFVDEVGIRQRFRTCNRTVDNLNYTHSACEGPGEEQEPCNTVQCPVNGGWSSWSPWSQCSSECDSGVQKRERFCSSPSPQHGGSSCPGPHIQTRECNSHLCSGVCPEGMMYLTAAECEVHGGACPRVCLDMTPADVQCATTCYDGCYCAPGFYLLNGSCVPLARCPCYHQGETHPAGATLQVDACNNCTCTNGEMECGAAPCPVDCGWSTWTQWSACSRTCDVGVRRRYRSGTDPPPAFGGQPCKGERVGMDTCSIEPCFGVKGPWTTWSECSVTCGGGYRSRTRGPIRVHGTAQQFSACNLQPCGDSQACPPGQQWSRCVIGAVSCTDVSMDLSRNCTPGCQCPQGRVQQDGVCVQESDCRCNVGGRQFQPGDVVPTDCNNCTCRAGKLVNSVGQWSVWTPWGQCSVSCGAGLQSRYRFCSSPRRSGSDLPCLGPHREDQVCINVPCDRDGGWGQWSNWTECTKSCGGGIQSRRRHCDSPSPEGEGNYCEGLGTEVITCNTNHCPVAPCSKVPGTAFSSCGPSCPRSCDDLAHCEWQCEPGCYCTEGKVLSANGTVCVEREDCPCLDLSTGQWLEPGESVESQDGCNNCTCESGRLNCTRQTCPVSGGWCEWSEWTPCSRTCGAESVSRYRSCSCPEPTGGGATCSGEQEMHNAVGVQIQRQPCPVISFCPVHGSWSPWSVWSDCDGCAGSSTRTRECNSPPAMFGGLPCLGESRQSRGCHDNITVCSDCEGGQVEWACGKPCPRSCSDLYGDTMCLDSSVCSRTCGCPGDMVLQDGVCVTRDECRCKYHNSSATGLDSSNASWAWPGGADWQFANPGDSIISDCINCSCEAGVLQCESVPGCNVDGESVGSWLPWSKWSKCSVSCGGGQQSRSRLCSSPPCSGLIRQSKICNTQVCLEVGCPPGRLYRECERSEGCPFNCAQISGREGCFSDACEEGCHCPLRTYQHHGLCLQVDGSIMHISKNAIFLCVSGVSFSLLSPSSGCEHGRWNCSLEHCPVDGGLSPWGPWSPCSLSCGGLGLKTRSRGCTRPAPAHGGRDCPGPRQETTYCQAPDCPDEDAGFSAWSLWSSCSKTCTDAQSPATKARHRQCVKAPCFGSSHQEKACNLPQCPDGGGACVGPDCAERNCTWTGWGEWSSCSRSCGVGQQQRIRTFLSPGTNGSWCEDILGGNQEQRFCNIKPCRVDGGWSRWSPWSRCDKRCGGGRSIRTRSCSSPPPKNGGKKCDGEKNQVKPCNTKPCDETGCPPGQEFVLCANQCPQRCADLQQGIECQSNAECQPGCRCPEGQLQQDGVCVQLWQCDCVDSVGQIWAAGSWHQVDCNNCSCSDGQFLCTNHSCQGTCVWSSWSSWASCSVSCGPGQKTRYRSLVPDVEGTHCQFEEVQHKSCNPGSCPPLCLHDSQEVGVGHTWLQGECKQCTCTPEGNYCQEIDCRVDGAWTPWSVWSDCSVTCGPGAQVRTRACINPPPRNNGSDCSGPERETRECRSSPCLDDLCPWSPWSACSRSCGAGTASRRRVCACEEAGDSACPGDIEAERNKEETQLCYRRPCPDCPMSEWSVWSQCSCESQRQQRYRVALVPVTRGQQCTPVETQSRSCSLSECGDCQAPFVYSNCGSPCEKQCGLLQQNGSCVPGNECGCVHLHHQASGQPPTVVIVPQGDTVSVGCSTCLCHDGTFHCDTRECEVVASEWSNWTPCSPCLPSSSLQPSTLQAGLINVTQMVSIQRRFRACLDLDSGFPVSQVGEEEEESQCPEPLLEERLCPDANICRDLCQWSAWSAWTACADPCSGGVRQRYRRPMAFPLGPRCSKQQTQSQSCNTGLCIGERCEDRGRTYHESCANQCPRTCADLWDHVQCLQGACHAGCRCPAGQLLQDGHCVPIPECRCGIPSGNGTLEYIPKQELNIDCNTCVCENGTLVCTNLSCPVYEPWSTWSTCSTSCGRGQRTRSRLCQDKEGGPPCADTEQMESCDLPPCPECPHGQVFSECSGSCPYTCEDLWPDTQCLLGPCTPGCTCLPGQVLYKGSCIPHTDCPCLAHSLPTGFQSLNVSTAETTEALIAPGTAIQHHCNTCVCQGGVFNCTSENCDACPDGEQWRRKRVSEDVQLCERSCEEIYTTSPVNCTHGGEGCVCEEGLYRKTEGKCVIPALCPCHDRGVLREAGSEWEESCTSCRCENGKKQCELRCPALHCAEGEVKVEEPGSCCPVCRKQFPEEPVSECQRYMQVRNITKGGCRLDNVEVSFCRGRCLSRTDVILEEPYLLSVCECCSYRLDPDTPVRFLNLRCENGESEPVVLPVIHSCECTSCQGGDLSRR
uniref:SCO-spondin n=1 Tax=Cynoglossus semilaevis TaxID=244447 RepID=A0A3P8V8E3_CYNSE